MTSKQLSDEKVSSRKWPGVLLLGVVALWLISVPVLGHTLAWSAEQVMLVSGLPWPAWAWFIWSIMLGLALLVPTGTLAFFWPHEPHRSIYRAWALGAIFVLFMAPVRLIQPPNVAAANVMQIALLTVAVSLLLILQHAIGHKVRKPVIDASVWLALLIAALGAYPWLLWGALGSLLDTLLNLTAALLFGLLAARISVWLLLRPSALPARKPRSSLLLGGLAMVPLLVEMASGFGFGGLQLILLMVVPSFGFAAAAVGRFPTRSARGGRTISAAALIGLVAAAPLVLVDPDELALVLALGTRDLLQWAFYASVVSASLGWLIGLALLVFWQHVRRLYRRPVLTVTSLLALALGAVLYLTVGQPGFYGDKLFVILEEQADLEPAALIDDIDARRAFVFDTLVDHAQMSQADLRQTLDRFGIEYRPYYLVNGLAVNGGPLIELWLNTRPEVDRVLQNPVLRPLRSPAPPAQGLADPPTSVLWNLQLIGADRVWHQLGVTGEGVVVGQSDSGVDGDHDELRDSYRGNAGGDDFNWYDPWYLTSEPTDIGGHGSHTLGTILGANTGVAPGAEWIGCVNLARNLANPSFYLDCMQFMLAPFPQDGDPFADGEPSLAADILNNSWGCPAIEGCDPQALLEAAQALRKAGIFVVVSAGNEGPFCESVQHPLALYDEVFSVGAVDSDGSLAFFSSVGPVTADGSRRTKPDILAPGVGVLSAFGENSYEYSDGTSMAGPHVAGVVALMWSANPALIGNIESTEEILQATARDYQGRPPACGNQGQPPYNGTGYGIVDAFAAVEAAISLTKGD